MHRAANPYQIHRFGLRYDRNAQINRGWTAPRRETSGQSRRRDERQIDRQGFFPQPRTRASIHETYGFSARLMGTGTMGIADGRSRCFVGEREACSGYEVRGWASVSASSDLRMGT